MTSNEAQTLTVGQRVYVSRSCNKAGNRVTKLSNSVYYELTVRKVYPNAVTTSHPRCPDNVNLGLFSDVELIEVNPPKCAEIVPEGQYVPMHQLPA